MTPLDRLISTQILGFGGASLSGEGGGYGFGEMDEKKAESLIREAFELGVQFFDTAPIYGFGLSEERLGRYAPPEAIILTKGGVHWHENKRVNLTNDPSIIEKMFHESRRRLGRECLDIYLIHWPDEKVDIRKPYAKLLEFKEKGWVKKIGLSNTKPDDFKKALEVAPVEVLQFEASFLVQDPAQMAISLQSLQSQLLLTTGWGTLAKGILTGRVIKGRRFDPVDARSHAPWWKWKEVEEKISKAQGFIALAKELNLTAACLGIFYSKCILKVDLPLVGFKSSKDLTAAQEFRALLDNMSLRELVLSRLNSLSLVLEQNALPLDQQTHQSHCSHHHQDQKSQNH
jgi:aryl-alcohol dehydrogenase-like predicted oxidoreductase